MPLTTKRAGKGYYKGNGSTKEGRLTSKGRFITDPKRRLELMVPDLVGFAVSLVHGCRDVRNPKGFYPVAMCRNWDGPKSTS